MSDPDQPEAPLIIASGVLVGLSFLVAFVLGSVYQTANIDGDEVFNWTLAAVAFAPLFLAGVILYAAAAIVDAVND